MPAAVYNFPIEQGSDFAINFIYRDENNNPVDLTGKCVVFQFAFDGIVVNGQCLKYVFSSQANSNYDTDNWSLSADSNGNIKIKISAEITKTFNAGSALYDLDITSQTDKLRNIRLSTGTITIVTRNFSNIVPCPSNLTPCLETYNDSTPVPSATPTSSLPTVTSSEDSCTSYDCLEVDLYSVVYSGSGLIISDNSVVSGSLTTTDPRNIENVELVITKLSHSNPSDLQFLLSPPTGNKILLAANHKTNLNSNFTFTFSNKAAPTKYLYNAANGDSINIYNKTNIVNYNNETLAYSFDHLYNNSITGVWNLIIRDTDPLGTGLIDSWKLIVTHSSEE